MIRKYITIIMIFSIMSKFSYAKEWRMWQNNSCHTGVQEGKGNLSTLGDLSVIWYYHIPGTNVNSQPMAADINNDGKIEIVANVDKVYAFSGDSGRVLWTFSPGNRVSSPAIGDLTGDGKKEIIIGSSDSSLYCLRGDDGSVIWSKNTGKIGGNSPVLADIDEDGLEEIIIGSTNGKIFALNGDSTTLWEITLPESYPRNSPAVGDLDGDGNMEIVIITEGGNVYVIKGSDGAIIWHKNLVGFAGVRNSPSIGDINGDGTLEIVTTSGYYASNDVLYVLSGEDGSILWSYSFGDYSSGTPVIVDIDKDTIPEIIVGSAWSSPNVYCFNNDGSIKWQAQLSGYNPGKQSCSVADINNDGWLEVVIPAETDLIATLDKDGNELWRFSSSEIRVWWTVKGPTIADVTGDGYLDIVWGSVNSGSPDGYVLVIGKHSASGVIIGKNSVESPVNIYSHPNPFKDYTTFTFSLHEIGDITLVLYNLAGEKIRGLIKEKPYSGGIHRYSWDGRNDYGKKVISGIYIYIFELKMNKGGTKRITKKIAVLK